jgi:hypothetical protein
MAAEQLELLGRLFAVVVDEPERPAGPAAQQGPAGPSGA